ncbi:hypothetical protein [Roseburia hominis]|uniref:hypothetical protein n=1 Tax=Roseburia hominis TaxID=301301 RepID=UPI0023673772|nr:hypothetical protein [Roseburia hominis]
MKYFSRKRKPKRFYVLVGLFTAMTLTAWANFTYIDHKAELTLGAGSKDDDVYTLCLYGEESSVDAYARQGGVSSGKLEELLNEGYCLQYIDSWKAAGLIPPDFTPASQKSSSSSSSTSSNDTQATATDNSGSDSQKSDTNSTKTYTDAEIDAAWKAVTTVDPTCATDGYTEYKNSLTGKTKQEAIPATGKHTYEVTDSTDATCIEAGSVTYTCSVCGDTYTEETDLAEHTYEVTETTDATCTEDGSTTYTCSVCGDTYEETIPATGHDDGEWTVTKSAGAFSTGTKELRCTVCGEVLDTETIPQTCPIPLFGVVAIVVIAGGVIGRTISVVRKAKKNKAD